MARCSSKLGPYQYELLAKICTMSNLGIEQMEYIGSKILPYPCKEVVDMFFHQASNDYGSELGDEGYADFMEEYRYWKSALKRNISHAKDIIENHQWMLPEVQSIMPDELKKRRFNTHKNDIMDMNNQRMDLFYIDKSKTYLTKICWQGFTFTFDMPDREFTTALSNIQEMWDCGDLSYDEMIIMFFQCMQELFYTKEEYNIRLCLIDKFYEIYNMSREN